MSKGIVLDMKTAQVAHDFLLQHATQLDKMDLGFTGKLVRAVALRIQEQINLQTPQSFEEQVKAMTEIFGCGPEPDFNK